MSRAAGTKALRRGGAEGKRARGGPGRAAKERRTEDARDERDERGQRDTRTARQRFLPYAYARTGLVTQAPRVELDGVRSDEPTDVDRHLVLVEDEQWEQARVVLPITVEPALLAEVVPESERAAPPLVLMVVVRCEATRLRRARVVAGPPIVAGTHEAVLELRREELRGSALLTPMLLRASDAEVSLAGYAALAGARVAGGRHWELRSEPQQPADGRFLDVRYRPFSTDPVLARYSDNVYRLELDQETPTLWINADHEPLVPVLGARGSTGKQARLREVFFDVIAQGVWTQLFVRAADELRQLGELPYPWQEVALRELLPLMYPELSSHRPRLEALREALQSDGLGAVIERLDAALQRKSELSRHMLRLVEEVLA